MTAFNIVRVRAKPEHEEAFLDINRNIGQDLLERLRQNGLRRQLAVKTGELSYCLIGEWETFDSIVASRPDMIGQLDQMRHMLEDLGGELGLTDPVSGEVVFELNVATPPARRSSRAGAGKARSTKPRSQAKKTTSRTAKRPARSASKPARGERPSAAKRTRTGRR